MLGVNAGADYSEVTNQVVPLHRNAVINVFQIFSLKKTTLLSTAKLQQSGQYENASVGVMISTKHKLGVSSIRTYFTRELSTRSMPAMGLGANAIKHACLA